MSKHKKVKQFLVTTLISFTIAFVAYLFVFAGNNDNSNNTGYNYVTVQKKDITQSVTATGVIKAEVGAEVKVGAQVSGIVRDLYVEVGSKVKKNQLLAVIDPGIYKAKLDEVLAQKENAEVEKKYAEIELQRYKALNKQNAVAKQQFDDASQKFELTRTGLKQAKADCELAKLQLNYTRILSPINGVVSSVATQEGETVAASFTSPTFVTIINLDRLELWAYVDETDIGKVKKGQKVTFYVDAYPGETIVGVVKTIHPDAEIQNNVVNYVVVVTIESHKGLTLRPQMDVTTSIYTEYKDSVLVVPKKAVRFDENGRKYVSMPINGQIKKRFITVGIADENYYEVISGLSQGDKVIIN